MKIFVAGATGALGRVGQKWRPVIVTGFAGGRITFRGPNVMRALPATLPRWRTTTASAPLRGAFFPTRASRTLTRTLRLAGTPLAHMPTGPGDAWGSWAP